MATQYNLPHVLNLSNSIIGVAVLAMPFCFQQCGIVLGIVMLFFCTWLTLISCKLLITAGISSRKRSYGFLAQYTHGAPGKLAVELGMIGLQIGTLIAQVVIIGDLGPAIISKWTGLPNTNNLRTALIALACTCIGLPLGLLRNLETVSRASTFCICFYSMFVLYVVGLSLPNLKAGNWYNKINMWRVEGLFKCLPIFSFAFGCQTQLFILYDALPEPSLKGISSIVSSAVNMCTVAYLLVGFFGYVAFCDTTIGGDIITQFSETFVVDIIQILFVLSIVVTFPLIIYPCRGSFYTLLFAQKPKHEDIDSRPIIPEIHFKVITICIVLFAMTTGILVPNVEFVLAFNGATMGTLICYIFPAVFFLRVMTSDKKNVAQFVFIVGVTIMVLCTYTTLNSQDHVKPKPIVVEKATVPQKVDSKPVGKVGKDNVDVNIKERKDDKEKDKKVVPPDKDTKVKSPLEEDKRQEPPNPHPPDKGPVEVNNSHKDTVKEPNTVGKTTSKLEKENERVNKKQKPRDKKTKDDGPNVLKKKDSKRDEAEVEVDAGVKDEAVGKDTEEKETDQKQQDLLDELKKQQIEHKKLIEEQREILKELKEHKREAHKEEDEDGKTQAPVKDGEKIDNQNGQKVNQNGQKVNQNGQKVNVQKADSPVNSPKQMNIPTKANIQQQDLQGQGQVNQQPQQINLQGQGQLNQQPQHMNLQGQGQLNQQPQHMNLQGQGQLNQQANLQSQQQRSNSFNQQQIGKNQQNPQNPNVLNIQGNQQPQLNQQQNIQVQGQVNQQHPGQRQVQQQQQQHQQMDKQPINNINNLNVPNQQNVGNSAGLKNPSNVGAGGNRPVNAQESRLSEDAPNQLGDTKSQKKNEKKPKTPHSDI